MVPLTASCPAVTVTLCSFPSLALTTTPLAGLALRAPLAGVTDSPALAAVTACADDVLDGCPADVGEPPLEHAATSRHPAAERAASTGIRRAGSRAARHCGLPMVTCCLPGAAPPWPC